MFFFHIRYLILCSIPAAAGCFCFFQEAWTLNFKSQGDVSSRPLPACRHACTPRRLNVQVFFSKVTTRNKLSIPSQTFTHTVLMGAEMTAHSLPGKNTLPFLSAFHHQFLIGSNELEFGCMLPHALQTLPHRGHVSLGAGSFSAPIPP